MILLDTCILLHIAATVPIPAAIEKVLRQGPWGISCLSAWEIGIKYALGKLPLPQPPAAWWPRAVDVFSLHVIPFTDVIALRAGSLPPIHADPFDRGIIATALQHDFRVASVDRLLMPYGLACGVQVIATT